MRTRQRAPVVGLAILLASVFLGACAADPAPPAASRVGAGAVGQPTAMRPITVRPSAATPLVASTSAGSVRTASAGLPAAGDAPDGAAAPCPAAGTILSFAQVLAMDPGCLGIEIRVRGWLDHVASLDGDAATLFPAVLRNRLPGTAASHETGAWLPVQSEIANVGIDERAGTWLIVRATVEEDSSVCRWVFAPGGEWQPESPAWTCPRHLQLLEVVRRRPPATHLALCPSTARPIAVERFSATPRACFGTRTVAVKGWFDTNYVISGWEEPWWPQPAWLWGPPIGRVAVLAPSANPTAEGTLALRLRPGSAPAHAARNRWVIIRGHYARSAETSLCRARSLVAGISRPAGAPTRVQAAAACARSFVVESVRSATP